MACVCTVTVDNTADLPAVIAAASPGDTICLADGSYGDLTLGVEKSAPGVKLHATNTLGPVFGIITLNAAKGLHFEGIEADIINGQGNTSDIKVVGCRAATVNIESGVLGNPGPGAQNWLIKHCDLDKTIDGYWGFRILANGHDPSIYWPISNITIQGNKLRQESQGADAIRISNWENVTVEDNEIFNVLENGQHCDGIQSVWGGQNLVFRRNYLHDNNCEPIFLKDGWFTNVLIEDNLIIRNDAGEAVVFSDIWNGHDVTIKNNTLWWDTLTLSYSGSHAPFPDGPFGFHDVHHNVIGGFMPYDYTSDDGNRAGIFNESEYMNEDYNMMTWGWTWVPHNLGPHSIQEVEPDFINPTENREDDLAEGDYRINAITVGGDTFTPGITWSLAGRSFGLDAYVPCAAETTSARIYRGDGVELKAYRLVNGNLVELGSNIFGS